MGEFIVIGDVSTDGDHGAWESPIRVTKDFGYVSFIKARWFWSVEKVKNLSLISCFPTRYYAEVKHSALSSHKSRSAGRRRGSLMMDALMDKHVDEAFIAQKH